MSWFVIILIVLIFCWPWIWRYLKGWLSRMAARRAEDMMRRMMGMPPREEEKRQRKSQRRAGGASGFRADEYGEDDHGGTSSSGRKRGRGNYSIAALMQLVAVDVQYVEIKEFGSTVIGDEAAASYSFRYEEQISDVKFVEIKDARK